MKKIFRYVRRLIYDIKKTLKHFRIIRTFKSTNMMVLTQVTNFNYPEMYISPEMTANLVRRFKLDPDTISNTSDGKEKGSACIGFSPKTQKWYGWSHRAIYGFGIGDIVNDGDLTATSGYVDEFEKSNPEEAFKHVLKPGFKAETLDDAKKMAIAYAAAVS